MTENITVKFILVRGEEKITLQVWECSTPPRERERISLLRSHVGSNPRNKIWNDIREITVEVNSNLWLDPLLVHSEVSFISMTPGKIAQTLTPTSGT